MEQPGRRRRQRAKTTVAPPGRSREHPDRPREPRGGSGGAGLATRASQQVAGSGRDSRPTEEGRQIGCPARGWAVTPALF
jgi:hypothetical protein